MFKKESIIKAIEIHKLGYKFLRFIADQIDNKNFTFSRVHNGENQTEIISLEKEVFLSSHFGELLLGIPTEHLLKILN